MTSWSSLPEHARIEPTLRPDPDLLKFAHAVLHQGQSLMVWRPAHVLLLGLAQSLQAHWQSRSPETVIAHFSGLQPAVLLGQINEKLSQQILQQSPPSGPVPMAQGIWFVHDAECLSTDELFLLLRLNAHFPGWTIRWVLLLNGSVPLARDKQALLAQSMHHWLKWQLDASSLPPALTRTPSPPNQAMTLLSQPRARTPARFLGRYKAALMGVLALMLAITGLVQFWPAQAPVQRPTAGLAGPSPSSPPRTTSSLQPPNSTGTQPALKPASTAPGTAPAQAMAPDPGAQHQASPALPDPADRATEPPRQDLVTTRPPTATAQRPAMPDVAARGRRWLSGLPQDSFVLEHGVFENAQQAQRLIKAHAELGNARIVMLKPTATMPSRFMVVTGPFRSLERAQNFKVRQQLPTQTHIEEVARVLQQSVSPSPREGPSKP